jgi:fluoride exporter
MNGIIAVFLGGGLGAGLRYLISLIAHNYGWSYQGTFLINMIGCLFLGFIAYIALKEETINPNLKLFLTTGIAGGFTTFSAFSYEIFTLIKDGQTTTGITYMLLSCIIGLMSAVVGILLAKFVLSTRIRTKTEDIQLAKEFLEE